jgi:hypothetical protein
MRQYLHDVKMAPRRDRQVSPGARPTELEGTVDTRTISSAGDPFTAALDHPHCCNDGWVTIGQIVVDEETGEETVEYALYLCRRCNADEAADVVEGRG